jgi:hypothetical protein
MITPAHSDDMVIMRCTPRLRFALAATVTVAYFIFIYWCVYVNHPVRQRHTRAQDTALVEQLDRYCVERTHELYTPSLLSAPKCVMCYTSPDKLPSMVKESKTSFAMMAAQPFFMGSDKVHPRMGSLTFPYSAGEPFYCDKGHRDMSCFGCNELSLHAHRIAPRNMTLEERQTMTEAIRNSHPELDIVPQHLKEMVEEWVTSEKQVLHISPRELVSMLVATILMTCVWMWVWYKNKLDATITHERNLRNLEREVKRD